MKKITLFMSLFYSLLCLSQNYTFTNATATYVDLVGTTSLSNDDVWDDPEYTLVLPFSMTINGNVNSEFTVHDSYITQGNTAGDLQYLLVLGNDLIDRSTESTGISPLTFKIDGVVGSRIAKIEFKNCGSFSDASLLMFVNFQIWLYEGTNIIEYRYGQNSVTDNSVFYDEEIGPGVGIFTQDAAFDFSNFFLLDNNPTSPTINTTSTAGLLNGTPPANRLYRFTPVNLSTDAVNKNSISLSPNPSKNNFFINGLVENSSFEIYDAIGKLVYSGLLSNNQNEVSTSSLQSGIYMMKIFTKENSTVKKFIKI